MSCFCTFCGLIPLLCYKLQKDRRINLVVQKYKALTGPICLLKEYKDNAGLKGPIMCECSYFQSIGGTVGPKVCRSRWAKSTSQVLDEKSSFPFLCSLLSGTETMKLNSTNGGLADGKRITLREDGKDKWEFFPRQAPRFMHLSSTVTFFLSLLQVITHGWLSWFFCFSRTHTTFRLELPKIRS